MPYRKRRGNRPGRTRQPSRYLLSGIAHGREQRRRQVGSIVKIGLSTPIVVQMPGVASAWEADGTAEDSALVGRAAENWAMTF